MKGKPDRLGICYPFVGDTVGGSHLSTLSLITHLDKERFEPRIVVMQPGVLTELLERHGLEYDLWPNTPWVTTGSSLVREWGKMAKVSLFLAARLRQINAAIVHTNDARMHLSWVMASLLAGKKHLWHQRSADPSRRNAFYSRFSRQVVTISEYCRNAFPPAMSRRALVVDNPVEVTPPDEMERLAKRSELLLPTGKSPDTPIIGFIGKTSRQKRPLLFVEAAKRIRNAWPGPLMFLMMGPEGEQLDETRQAVEKAGLGPDLLLAPPRFPAEPWLGACDMLLAPAVREGLGRVVLEAMQLQVPVVAAASGGHLEIIREGETGRLVPADDAEAMAGVALAWLADPHGRADLARMACEEATRRFSPRAHARRMMEIYGEMAGLP